MTKYSENGADTLNQKRKVSKRILIIVYLCIWALPIAMFWIVRWDAIIYSLVVLYFIMPLATIITSIFIGKNDEWSNIRWVMLLFFGLMYMLSYDLTFSLINMIARHKLNKPNIDFMLPGILLSALGMCIGTIIRVILRNKEIKIIKRTRDVSKVSLGTPKDK